MDELIRGYIDIKFDGIMHDELYKGFSLFSKFNYIDYSEDYINLLMSESTLLPDDMYDMFIKIFIQQVNYIINSHLINLTTDATVPEMVEVMSFLYEIQDIHDFNHLHTIIDSSKDPYEVLALMINDYGSIETSRAMQILDDIDPIFYNKLTKYIIEKATYSEDTLPRFSEVGKRIVENMREFISYLKNENILGRELIDSGILLDQSMSTYYTYVANIIGTIEEKSIPVNILSLLYLNIDGINNPLQEYSETAHIFMSDLDTISKVKNEIANIVSDYNSFLKAKHEQNRVSQNSNT